MIGRRRARRRAPVPDRLTPTDRARLERRRADTRALLGAERTVAARIDAAPDAYVLVHTSSDLARHCELLDPLPPTGVVRVVVTPTDRQGDWHLDIATRDRPGLLAAFSGVLAAARIEVLRAVLATWPDGAALQAFTVRAAQVPDVAHLQPALTRALTLPHSCDPVADAVVRFDPPAGALYTGCEIVAQDRPGLLHAFAVAIAALGIDIHAASVATHDGIARDRFDLSDARGRRLDHALEASIVTQLQAGTRPPVPALGRTHGAEPTLGMSLTGTSGMARKFWPAGTRAAMRRTLGG
jgi:[protein-PII] uridylyltransferase